MWIDDDGVLNLGDAEVVEMCECPGPCDYFNWVVLHQDVVVPC